MTPRKEIFIKIQEALKTIGALELVDLDRKQFLGSQESYPGCFTAALIKSPSIRYETMTEERKEGTAEIEVVLYCKDGWMHQHQNTTDPSHGLIEIDLIDAIVEKLELLYGESFKPLEQTSEDEEDVSDAQLMSFKIGFITKVYKTVNKKFSNRKLNIKQL